MPITAFALYDYIDCPQRAALDAFWRCEPSDPVKPFVKLLWERGTAFEHSFGSPFSTSRRCPMMRRSDRLSTRSDEALIYSGRVSVENPPVKRFFFYARMGTDMCLRMSNLTLARRAPARQRWQTKGSLCSPIRALHRHPRNA
jgi:hypothetical protein